MNFGPLTSEPDSYAIMDKALELGINFFDTANVYGRKLGEGVTEQIIGRWLAQGGGRREQIVLATKVLRQDGRRPERPAAFRPTTSAAPARRACAGCRPTTSTCTRCTTSTATRPGRRSGRRWSSWCARARCSTWAAATSPAGTSPRPTAGRAARHFMGLVSRAEPVQPERRARSSWRSSRPAAAFGLGVIPWSPLGGGLLAGAAAQGPRPARPARRAEPRASRSTQAPGAAGGYEGFWQSWASSPPMWRWPGCWATRSSPRRSSARAPWSSWRAACGRWRSSSPRCADRARRNLARPGRRSARGLRLVSCHPKNELSPPRCGGDSS